MTLKSLLRRPIRRSLEQSVARLIRRNPKLKVVAVAGSVGKTSTKMAVATVLGQRYRVLANHSNYNSEFGLPLAIFELYAPDRITDVWAWLGIMRQVARKVRRPFPYDVLVLELGTDKPGDLAAFMRYLTPDIAVVTAIAPEHMEFFGDLAAVGDEEFTVALGARAVAVHVDDPELAARRPLLGERPVVTYGTSGEIHWAGGDRLCLGGERAEAIKVTPQVIGEHLRLTLLAAAAIAVRLGLSSDEIKDGIDAVTPVPGRMQRLSGIKGVAIIDDSYNSSPDAAIAALTTLEAIGKGRKIALLGQMNELGDYSRQAHEAVGAAAAGVDVLLTLSGDANTILGPAAIEAGLKKSAWHGFDSPYAAGAWLAKHLRAGDTLLVKGSQNGVYAEEAIKPLLADPTDETKLVRQSPAWLAKKRAQFDDAPAPRYNKSL